MLCPRDGAQARLESTKGHRGGFALDVCPKCGGSWFDKGEIARASGKREVERLIVAYAGGATGLSCPRCGRGMAARPVGDIVLSVCLKCRGVWVDAGVLEEAARTLGGEFSVVTSTSAIGGQFGEFPGATRAAQLARVTFAGLASPTLRYLLNPKISRKYPPDDL